MRGYSIVLAGATVVCACLPSAQGTLLTDWDAPDVVITNAASGDVSPASRDIIAMRYTLIGADYYFRMDLSGASTNASAPDYGIMIDNVPDGGTAVDSPFIANIPGGVQIDRMLISEYQAGVGWKTYRRYIYQGDTSAPPHVAWANLLNLGGAFDANEGGGSMLQWRVPVSEIGEGPMDMWAATMDVSGLGTTYDVAGPIHTPEPATLTMMGVLCSIAVALFYRRRAVAR